MNHNPSGPVATPESFNPKPTTVPVDTLVVDVFESSPPQVQNKMLTQLIGQVYDNAPMTLRDRLLKQLLNPLGVLPLAVIANGIFMSMASRRKPNDLDMPLDGLQRVQVSDVIALVDYVQQTSLETINSVGHLVESSPLMTGSAAAAVLVAVLLRRTRRRKTDRLNIVA